MPGLVAGVDEAREIVRRAEAAGRREEPDRLVAPGAVERDIRVTGSSSIWVKPMSAGIGDQRVGQLAIGQESTPFFGIARHEPRWTS